MNDQPTRSLDERLAKLEHDNRRLRTLGSFSLIALTAIIGVGAAQRPEVPDVLRAHRFVLEDVDGQERLTIGFEAEAGPSLIVFDNQNRKRITLGLNRVDADASVEPHFSMLNEKEEPQATLRLVENIAPSLELNDPSRTVQFCIESDDKAIGAMIRASNVTRSMLGISPTGTVGLSFRDHDDAERFKAACQADGNSAVQWTGPNKALRMSFECTDNGRLACGIYDYTKPRQLNVAFSDVRDDAGTLILSARNAQGELVARPISEVGNLLGTPEEHGTPDSAVSPRDTLEAERLVLRDKEGRVRIELDADDEGNPAISLRDPEGTNRLRILLAQGKFSEITTYSEQGQPLTTLAEAENEPGDSFLAFYDKNQKGRIDLGVETDGGSYLRLLDGNQNVRARMVLDAEGTSEVATLDHQGRVRISAAAYSDGTSMLRLMDSEERDRIRLDADGEGKDGPALTMFDADGMSRASLLQAVADRPDGKTHSLFALTFHDAEGRTRFQANTFDQGRSNIGMFDADQNDRLSLVTDGERSSIAFFNEDGISRLSLLSDEHGPRVELYDTEESERVGLAILEDERGVVRLLDADSNVRSALGTTAEGDGYVATFSTNGKTIFQGPEVILRDVNQKEE